MLVLCVTTACGGPESTYNSAQNLLSQGKYSKAAQKFESLGGYEDSSTLATYCKACELCESGDFKNGISALESLGDYKDCKMRAIYYKGRSYEAMAEQLLNSEYLTKANKCYQQIPVFLDCSERIKEMKQKKNELDNQAYYKLAKELYNEQKYTAAYMTFLKIEDYKDVASMLSSDGKLVEIAEIAKKQLPFSTIGNTVNFGVYEQDDLKSNGKEPISWLILDYDPQTNEALLISKCGLEAIKYHSSEPYPTWEQSDLRTWLNSSFLNAAFSPKEREAIVERKIYSHDGSSTYHDGDALPSTKDKVFILDELQADKYFKFNSDKLAPFTNHVFNHLSSFDQEYNQKNNITNCNWWLRSVGYSAGHALFISHTTGEKYSTSVKNVNISVRPVIVLNLDNLNF